MALTPVHSMRLSVFKTTIAVAVFLCACGRSSAVPAEAADTTAPSWYKSPIPWAQLPIHVRARLVRIRDSVIRNPPAEVRAYEGKKLLARIARNYGLQDSVQTSTVDGREIVWVPEDLWPSMIQINQEQIEIYASRSWPKWGIGVGPVRDGHIVESRVVVQH
jgi:hypothetical protein